MFVLLKTICKATSRYQILKGLVNYKINGIRYNTKVTRVEKKKTVKNKQQFDNYFIHPK